MSYTRAAKVRNHWIGGVALATATIVCFGLSSDRAEAMDALLAFSGCTSNNVGDVAIAEAQMSVKVSDPGGNQVRFDFLNSGPDASSITDIYFDHDVLLNSLFLIDDSDPGVAFSPDANPEALPGAADCDPAFTTDTELSADSDAPVQPNGVNPDEFLGVVFDLVSGKDYGAVLADLGSGALRVGIRVQGFASGGSEGLVSQLADITNQVPEPGTLAMFGLGFAGVVFVRRRKRPDSLTV